MGCEQVSIGSSEQNACFGWESMLEVKMSVRTSRKVITPAWIASNGQRGISGVTVAVVIAALAVVTLTIVQAVTTGDSSAVQSGIPALIG